MSTPLLSDDEIAAGLRELPGWTRTGASISRTVEAPSFLAGIDLVRRVADSAEKVNHHPDIDIRWRRVTFTLSTHSEGGITRKDLALAGQIDRLADQS
ncbi:4a-hydroxytetrahydrobiopterin dehydratase [Nocardia veterana]|uniref:Putative pterin-4-alpha-carbinolamine dehydratase n=1 Tax=Nocardia veterana TaxID=132249 RepID=A0A7X6LWG2_9NOCA|nr:4a-hydroxytetrahydrobiopterin dehydratase [Nocardia veterana]NKY85873.1 4a-hydroxytetrahydrobiopterin dehydratase [Nocardia veterana]